MLLLLIFLGWNFAVKQFSAHFPQVLHDSSSVCGFPGCLCFLCTLPTHCQAHVLLCTHALVRAPAHATITMLSLCLLLVCSHACSLAYSQLLCMLPCILQAPRYTPMQDPCTFRCMLPCMLSAPVHTLCTLHAHSCARSNAHSPRVPHQAGPSLLHHQ